VTCKILRSAKARGELNHDIESISPQLDTVCGGMMGCGAAGELCTNPQCNKDADAIFEYVCDRHSTE
jgi:hypothetical protein